MKNNIGQICVEFNHTAVKLFKSLYKKYNNAVDGIEQKDDENKLLQLSTQYINTLKQQLDAMALSLMDKYKAAVNEVEHFQVIVADQINFYLKEFNTKAKLL